MQVPLTLLEDLHEKVTIYGIADRHDSQGRGSGSCGGTDHPQAWNKRGDVLPLEVEVRRSRGVGAQATA